ncbi:MAG: biosynthetic-type acetolactate synthase large subunit [Actinomycetia bacterium]|nr:biosynthetic-type acetolactate synthase large subunit [Actinomycetes bacterium]MCP4959425.1 biosynthetic-type acetolactate synthase large subunit [Actinomycetes bacterium]
MRITGAQALIKSLELSGVEVVFGLPGGAILPVYDPIIESPIRHVLVRHEQGAGHMASGYATVTGKPGVVIVTSGPAATNIVTPLMDAYMDSVPMVAITGQVAFSNIGTDAFQECDTVGITRSVTKHNELITDPADIPRLVQEAFHIATTGRPGPVLLDLPKDIANMEIDWDVAWEQTWGEGISLPGYQPSLGVDPAEISEAVELIRAAQRPVVYAGGGIMKARAVEALREFVDMAQIPTVTTLMARGALPDDHPLCFGMPGMHGAYAAITALQQADLLLAFGSRFDDRVTGKVDAFAPHAKVVHVDIDPAEHGKVRQPDVSIIGDARLVIEAINAELRSGGIGAVDLDPWKSTVSGWQETHPFKYEQSESGFPLKPQYCLEKLNEMAPEGTIVVAGVGQHQMWASQFWRFNKPYSWVNSGGLGTMGYAVPAAVGAKAGRPDATVWAIDGDGCFQMTFQELITAAAERIPVKIAILNNAYLGMVRQWQELFYEERYSEVYLSQDLPDYAKLAEAMGCVGLRAEKADEVESVIEQANAINDRPVVVDFRVDEFEKVYPMVPAGGSNDVVILGPEGDAELGKSGVAPS